MELTSAGNLRERFFFLKKQKIGKNGLGFGLETKNSLGNPSIIPIYQLEMTDLLICKVCFYNGKYGVKLIKTELSYGVHPTEHI
jgi:hypothetical protein